MAITWYPGPRTNTIWIINLLSSWFHYKFLLSASMMEVLVSKTRAMLQWSLDHLGDLSAVIPTLIQADIKSTWVELYIFLTTPLFFGSFCYFLHQQPSAPGTWEAICAGHAEAALFSASRLGVSWSDGKKWCSQGWNPHKLNMVLVFMKIKLRKSDLSWWILHFQYFFLD